jgi:AcrR family transcriptional regulator
MSKAEKTKQFIIEKTASLFNTKGYTSTSLSDITKATGLTKGSIYGNFENRDKVALEVYQFNAGSEEKYANLLVKNILRCLPNCMLLSHFTEKTGKLSFNTEVVL